MSDSNVLYVEGNIGAGKSTVLRFLEQYFDDLEVVFEPYDLWQDVDGNNLLKNYFLDPKKYAFPLQHYVTVTRVEQLKNLDGNHQRKNKLIERSVFSSRYCFAQNAYDMSFLNETEWALYKKLWDLTVGTIVQRPVAFIYVRTPAQICFERIAKRSRFEERPITLEYLVNLEKKHDQMMLDKAIDDALISGLPTLVLDGSIDILSSDVLRDNQIQKIKVFLDSLK